MRSLHSKLLSHVASVRVLTTVGLLAGITISAATATAQSRTSSKPDQWSERELDAAAKRLDRIILEDLEAHGQRPTARVDDATFLRRAYLRIAGRIPSAEETRRFLARRGSSKRDSLVDELLHSSAHVARMLPYWSDLFRAKDQLARRTSGAPFQDYLRTAVTENLPFDEFARRMLVAEGPAHARDNGATGYLLRDLGMPHDNMANTARVFLGQRIECAQCHNHPFDKSWLQRDFFALAAAQGDLRYTDRSVYRSDAGRRLLAAGRDLREQYGQAGARAMRRLAQNLTVGIAGGGSGVEQLPEDYQYDDAAPGATVGAGVPFGQLEGLEQPRRLSRREASRQGLRGRAARNAWTDVGSRAAFADWLIDADNPRFAAVIAARMWKLAMGRGPIEPVDDLRTDTQLPNPELWDALADLMREVDFDLRLFQRVLYRTDLFAREAVAPPAPEADAFRFPGPVIERMTAEQLWDSLVTLATGDADASITAPGEHAERVYSSYEGLLSLGPDELRERLEREALRYSDPDAYRRMLARERNERRAAAQAASSKERAALRERAAPLLAELRQAKRKKDQRRVAQLTAQLRGLREQVAAEMRGDSLAPPPRRGLIRASELPSPAPDDHLLRAFGQSDRETIQGAHREATVPQALMLLNGFVDRELAADDSAVMTDLAEVDSAGEQVMRAYRLVLQRSPSSAEKRQWLSDLREDTEQGLADLVWTLVNSHEFRFVR